MRQYLSIPNDLKVRAREQANSCSNPVTRYDAFINFICLHTLSPYLKELLQEQNVTNTLDRERESELLTIWEFVNGSNIEFRQFKVVLVPIDIEDEIKIKVPQEWVDIPSWAGDYYIFLSIGSIENDEDVLNIHGFTTHSQLRYSGQLNQKAHSYSLPAKDLIEDLSVMQYAQGLCIHKNIEELATLTEREEKQFLYQLSNPQLYSPRLQTDIPFKLWAAILENETLRQELFEKRLARKSSSVPTPTCESIIATTTSTATETCQNLQDWLKPLSGKGQTLINEVWQTYEEFFSTLRPAVRNAYSRYKPGNQATSHETIKDILPLLEERNSEDTRCHAAGVLGKIAVGNSFVAEALAELVSNARTERTRWQAALSLGSVMPQHPQAGTRKVRVIDMGFRLNEKLALVVALLPKEDDRLGVSLRVETEDKSSFLPPSLQLRVVSELGEPIKGLLAEARGPVSTDSGHKGLDKCIQLRFNPKIGTCFQVEVALGDTKVSEFFIA